MSFTGKVIAVTGKLSLPRKEITKIIEENGGIFVATITKKVTHLICADPNSTEDGEKLKKAKTMGIQIVGPEFLTNTSNAVNNTTSDVNTCDVKTDLSIEPPQKKTKTSVQLKIHSKPKKSTSSTTKITTSKTTSKTKVNDKTIEEFTTFIEKMTSSNSNLDKGTNFKAFMQKASDDFTEILKYIYNEQMKFGITSKNVVKFEDTKYEDEHYVSMKLVDFIQQLVETELTGHNALKVAVSFLNDYPEHRDTLLAIFDKDLKIRFGLKSVNAIIPDFVPEFNVCLGNPYNEKTRKHVDNGDWFISRKLDGVRCLTVVKVPVPYNGDTNGIIIECYSRGGLQFRSLDKVKNEIRSNINLIIPHIIPLPNSTTDGVLEFVFDGEMCVIRSDGSEDYRTIVSEIKRKSTTVQNPRYLVFDLLTYHEFKNRVSEEDRTFRKRLDVLKQFLPSYMNTKNDVADNEDESDFPIMKLLPQMPFTEEMFLMMSEQSEKNGWEGLMLRKDAVYSGDRSNDILKVKRFETEEYEVQDVVFGDVTVINEDSGLQEKIETMVSVVINHIGPNANTGQMDTNQINVGSGFSQQERQMFYDNPQLIKGKTISVQFFEKTHSRDGKESLRFPTFKGLHGKKRVI